MTDGLLHFSSILVRIANGIYDEAYVGMQAMNVP